MTRPGAPPCPEGFGRYLCNPVRISFMEQGKRATKWDAGKTWGIRLYNRAGDPGMLFTLQVQAAPPHQQTPVGIGPNQILAPRPAPTRVRIPASQPSASPVSAGAPPTPSHSLPSNADLLWKTVEGAYRILNASRPELTKSCCLCLDAKPPYYEGFTIKGDYTAASTTSSCRWQQTAARLTLQAVTGQGTCIGNVPSEQSHLCNETLATPKAAAYLLPPENAWWACSSGLAPCIHSLVLNSQKEGFCILVQLIPKLIYHSGEEVLNRIDAINSRSKREPITALTVAALLGLGLVGARTGISSLVIQDKNYGALRAAIDLDIERIEKSITHLQESLTSLSEIVLQNRRGLDLLFMQQGGLCAALGEECCFYVDHSGVVKETMALVREGLQKRKLEREQSQSWYEFLFNWSPWLTTLVSALVGPLVILLMLLTFGPCIINKLVQFVKEHIGIVQLMVLQSQYRPLPTEDEIEMQPIS
ncbi:PREDICTED: retrovirus-related Env polyprotein from Fv-4 locus [Myotis davidii]|uniref:retrovirus-related Env polyprotein from Fv-4 locus n=1 Tax=Myotis davidii TaxID=225400 RepID=UPI000767253B|nr:PREDICTED: retrovirus-related Env polyprotein from Fv-4 locus [Myotis davidii]